MTVAIPPLAHRIERLVSNREAPSSTLGGRSDGRFQLTVHIVPQHLG